MHWFCLAFGHFETFPFISFVLQDVSSLFKIFVQHCIVVLEVLLSSIQHTFLCLIKEIYFYMMCY